MVAVIGDPGEFGGVLGGRIDRQAPVDGMPGVGGGILTPDAYNQMLVDSSSFSLTLDSGTRNAIQWLAAKKHILIGTTGGEWKLSGHSNKPFTPFNYDLKEQTFHGSKDMQAIRISDAIAFVNHTGRELRKLRYDGVDEDYQAPDLSILAEHITDSGIVDMAYQRNPDHILWAIRADGTLLSMTYDPEQKVIAWARHFMGTGVSDETSSSTTSSTDLSGYTDSYVASNNGIDVLNADFALQTLGNVAGGTTIDLHPTSGEVVMGTTNAIMRYQSDGSFDTTHYVPDGGWDVSIDIVRAVRYTFDGLYLYAVINITGGDETLYKFEVSSGDEVWNLAVGWDPYGMGIDSSDNVYVPGKAALLGGRGVQKVNSDGTMGTHYDADGDRWRLPRDVFVDETNDILLASGTFTESGLPLDTAKILAWNWTAGTYKWVVKQAVADANTKQIWAVKTKGSFIYACGGQNAIKPPGVDDASVWKLDLDGNIVDSYDTGDDCTHLWWRGDGNLVVKGSTDNKIFVLDDDLTLVSSHDYAGSGLFGAEGVAFPAGIDFNSTTTTTTTSYAQQYNSVAVIPSTTSEDEVWFLVNRDINGASVQYVERMKPHDWGDDMEDMFFVDAGLTYDGVATNNFTGLDHLEGETVKILGDGAVFPSQVVTGGTLPNDLDHTVSVAQIGLPYTYKLKPMRMDQNLRGGVTKGSIKKIAEAVISFFKTLNARYGDGTNYYDINWRETDAEYTTPPDLVTGDKVVVADGGFAVEDPFEITGNDPMPCSVRAIIPRIEKTGR